MFRRFEKKCCRKRDNWQEHQQNFTQFNFGARTLRYITFKLKAKWGIKKLFSNIKTIKDKILKSLICSIHKSGANCTFRRNRHIWRAMNFPQFSGVGAKTRSSSTISIKIMTCGTVIEGGVRNWTMYSIIAFDFVTVGGATKSVWPTIRCRQHGQWRGWQCTLDMWWI